MLMQRTSSAPRLVAASAARSGLVSGLNATPTASPSARAAVGDARGVGRDLDVERDGVRTRRGELLEVMRGVVDHQVAVEHAARRRGCIGAIDRRTTGPIVTGGTKCPSPQSKWKTRQPAASSVVDLLAEPPEVGGVERRLDLDAAADPVAPAHAAIVVG